MALRLHCVNGIQKCGDYGCRGEDIVCADSFWSMVDIATGRPVKIEESDTEGYELEEQYPMASLGRKLSFPIIFLSRTR